MRGHRWYAIPALTVLFVCALIAAGCGDDDETTTSSEATTTTTTSSGSAEDKIDAAVKSCGTKAQELSEAAGAALQAACTTVGDNAKQALAQGSAEALSKAEDACKSAVAQLPARRPGGAHGSLRRNLKQLGACSTRPRPHPGRNRDGRQTRISLRRNL